MKKLGLSSMGVRIRGRGREGKGFLVRLWKDGIAQMSIWMDDVVQTWGILNNDYTGTVGCGVPVFS